MVSTTLTFQKSMTSLTRRWLTYTLMCGVALVAGWFFLQRTWEATYASRWAILTAPVLVYQIWFLWSNLAKNHRPGEQEIFSSLGLGNTLTLIRGVLFAGLTGFLFSPRPEGTLSWAPGILYTLGILIDMADGYAARRKNQVTKLGEILDISMDGWGMLMVSTLAVQYGQVPVWYLMVGWARYLYLGGLWLRQRLGWAVYDLPSSVIRRPFAALQMGFVSVIVWPIFYPPATHYAAVIFAFPFLVSFLRDWLVVSGTIPGDFTLRFEALKRFFVNWLPLGLRLAIVFLLIWQWLESLGRTSPLHPASLTGVVLSGIALGFILLGAAGRMAAVVGLVALGFFQMVEPLSSIQIGLVWLYGALAYLGTGMFSTWKPEDRYIFRRAGEKSR